MGCVCTTALQSDDLITYEELLTVPFYSEDVDLAVCPVKAYT